MTTNNATTLLKYAQLQMAAEARLMGSNGTPFSDGKDTDILKGGAGNDTCMFASGDGWNWVVDSDGSGRLLYGLRFVSSKLR
jgi:Ca2+-binding RTX toxin-like protein